MILAAIGLIDPFQKTARFKALKLQKATKLEILSPFQSILLFGYDIMTGTVFNVFQYATIAFLYLLYTLQGIKLFREDRKKE